MPSQTAGSALVDAHVHLWDVSRRHYAWLQELPAINRTYGTDELDEASEGSALVAYVYVECAGAIDATLSRDEVIWVEGIARHDVRLAGIVAFAPLETGGDVAPHLAWLRDRPFVKGVRRLLQAEPDPEFCLRAPFVEAVRMLPEYDLRFDICIYHHQFPGVIRLVEMCPDVDFVLDHLGKPGIRDGIVQPWREHLASLASLPNVVCKISGALTEADPDAWTDRDVVPYLEAGIEAFGEDRILFGGDWPVVNLAGTYAGWLDLVLKTVSHFTDAQKLKLFGGNARRVYGLEGPEERA